MSIKAYAAADKALWDQTVQQSCNGNMLHLRGYMDYHQDRFEDCSLIVLRNGKPAALFPANRDGKTVSSHGGLTYGGLLHTKDFSTHDTLAAFDVIREHYRSRGVQTIFYKASPSVFHRLPSENDLYALTHAGAKLIRRDASSVIYLQQRFTFSKGRKWSLNKARHSGISLRQSHDFERFHALLSGVLSKFRAQPTHSCAELELLARRFPDAITLHVARSGENKQDRILAGAVVYDFGQTVHTQYMASSDEGRERGALDLLLAELIFKYRDRSFFSFGVSTEEQGMKLNVGLISYKEAFGARTVVHDFYSWTL